MNKKTILPFALTGLVAVLSACGGGGESAVIHEDPNKGVSTTKNGCEDKVDNTCQSFVVDYPIAGLNFDCSTDKNNHFVTEMVSNVAMGACPVGDKITFYIQGKQSAKKISLGTVDLNKVRPLKINNQPAQISLMDMASGLTGKEITSSNVNDETFRVLTALVRMFQAIGIKQDQELVAGDIQPLTLSKELKEDLKDIESDIGVQNFKDGTYVKLIKPWVDIAPITEATAQQTAQKLINLSNVYLYNANFLAASTPTTDIGGFSGKSTSTKKEAIANLYILTTRAGYSLGYAVQWTGTPITTSGDISVISPIARINLLTQVSPNKLDAAAQSSLISPFTKKIEKPFVLNQATTLANNLEIYQGMLFNNTTVPGTEFVYKQVTGSKTGPTDSSAYGKWKQTLNNENFTGTIDISKTSPATYLNNEVFRTVNTVKPGKKYYFPLYANLVFSFKDTTIAPVKLGIVIDANGDIRTNIGANASANNLTSDQCPNINESTYKDDLGVQQYRIGTTGAANYDETDKSVTLRMILANPIFGNLDGVVVGLNENLIAGVESNASVTGADRVESKGVRLNLQRLIVDDTTSRGINITGWQGDRATTAEWVNMYSLSQATYNKYNSGKVTAEQKALVARSSGELDVELPSCYQIKAK
ncbi:hypothetical protein [Acinetobacter defluvii]|uniref:putative pilus system protein FilF n=1 Tax=Acinetobacter defluvii TaxID=1871111 RepID=UPI003AF52FD0